MTGDGELIEDSRTLRFIRLLPGPIERVWDYLAGADKLSSWLGAGTIEPRVGGAVNIQGGHITGVVLDWSPPRRLAYTWIVPDADGASLISQVAFALELDGDKVRLTLTAGAILPGFELPSLTGWDSLLTALEMRLGGADPGPMMDRWRATLPHYQSKFAEALSWGSYEDGGAAVRFTRFLFAPVERVWAYVADADLRAAWFYGGQFDPVVGGEVAFADDISGVVTAYEPPRLFAFTWVHPTWDNARSDVRIEVAPAGPGTILTLTHTRMAGKDRLLNAGGWHAHLAALTAHLVGVPASDRRASEGNVAPAYERAIEATTRI
jgi:uncharacterized protein YndB with AHSA1/START domain